MKTVKILCLFVLSFVLMSSCIKKTEAYVEGKWERVDVSKTATRTEVWKFEDGKLTVYYISPLTKSLIYIASGTYTVERDGTYTQLDVVGFPSQNSDTFCYDGSYEIYKKNKGILGCKDQRGAFYEFIAYQEAE